MNDGRWVINSRKYNGEISRSWACRLVERTDTSCTFVGEFADSVDHGSLGRIEKGTISYEYFWLDRWYSIFRFENPRGTIRNYYCNINCPPILSKNTLDYIDLDIDVVIWPDGRRKVLDLDEFRCNAVSYAYSVDTLVGVRDALNEIIRMADNDSLP